jgi:Squalene epoxidase
MMRRVAHYHIWAATAPSEMCTGVICTAKCRLMSAGGMYSSGPVGLLSGLTPQPHILIMHFFMVALFGVGRLPLRKGLRGCWLAVMLLVVAVKIIVPIIWAEGLRCVCPEHSAACLSCTEQQWLCLRSQCLWCCCRLWVDLASSSGRHMPSCTPPLHCIPAPSSVIECICVMTFEGVVQGRVHAKHCTTAILAPIATLAEERAYHRSTISMIFAGRMSVSLVPCVQRFAVRQCLLTGCQV